ncbi:MAG TPA: ABC transporter permease [Gaiellaceae bacterium]|nr:ABC transporter permease [Gaiellaceae bacterium]
MRAALLVTAKDLRQRLRDRSAILVAVVVPLALAAVFALVIPESDDGITFRYAVVDLDRGPASAPLLDALRDVEAEGVAELRTVGTREEARRLADEGEVSAALIVPAGFSAAARSAAPAHLEVIGDVDAPIGTLVARSLAAGFAAELDTGRLAAAAAQHAGGSPEEAAERAASLPRPIELADVTAEEKGLDSTTYYAAGMAVFFLFFTVQLGISSLLDEKRDGTLARLFAAPVPRTAVLAGKVLTSVVVGLVSMTVLVLATTALLGADWGDPLGVALLVLAGVLAATGATALTTTWARTPEQASAAQSVVALVLAIVGGTFFPVEQAGGLLARVSLLTPHAWFLEGLGDLTAGAGAADVLAAAGAMLAFAAVTTGLALLRVRRLLEP